MKTAKGGTRIYILADMEGISGIRMLEQVQLYSHEYEDGRKLMIQDINVAVQSAFNAGASEVVVCDTHAGGGQVRIVEMDPRPLYETPIHGNMMPSLDETFDGVILLGHHARAGTLHGFLDHTMDSSSWFEYSINDVVVGEIGIEAAYAGHFDVPVIVVTGDAATCSEANSLLGKVECAAVKWGLGRNRAKCLSLPRAKERIQAAIQNALASIKDFKPYKPDLPAMVKLTLYRSDMAEARIFHGVERVDARTIKKTISSFQEMPIW